MEAMGREMVVIDPGHGGDERTPVRLYCFVRAKIGDAYAVLSFLEVSVWWVCVCVSSIKCVCHFALFIFFLTSLFCFLFLQDYCDSELDGDESPGLMITFEGVLEILKHGDPSTLRDIKIIKDVIIFIYCHLALTLFVLFLLELQRYDDSATRVHVWDHSVLALSRRCNFSIKLTQTY